MSMSKSSLLIILTSLTIAVSVAGVLLWQFPVAHSTVAIVQTMSRPSRPVFPDLHSKLTEYEIKRFENSQLEIMTSDFVIQSALNRTDIAQLNAVKEKEPDPVEWLQTELQVSFPSGSGVLEVRYEGPQDTEEMKKILSAIIAAFQQDVLGQRRIEREDHRSNLDKLSSDLTKELKEKLDNYYALSEELSFKFSGKTKSFYVATEEELDKVSGSMREFIFAQGHDKVNAAQQLIDIIPKTWREASEPIEQQSIQDAQLTMLRRKIDQLHELNDKVYLRLLQWKIEDRMNTELFRVLQPPMATENTRSISESIGIAAMGGLSSFLMTCLGLLLVSSAKSYKIAAFCGFFALMVACVGLLLIVGFI